jgi:divalent metal cation (Fe/Co/Zn/Cd) transporter
MFYAWFTMQMTIHCDLKLESNPDGSVNSFSRITEKVEDKIMSMKYNKFFWTKRLMPFMKDPDWDWKDCGGCDAS